MRKKKFFAALLCVLLLTALLPATAQAASSVRVAGTGLNVDLYYCTNATGNEIYTCPEALANVWLTAEDELHIRNLNITYERATYPTATGSVYGINVVGPITLVLHGSNSITVRNPDTSAAYEVYGIYVSGSTAALTIKEGSEGGGALTIDCSNTAPGTPLACGIRTTGSLTVDSGSVTSTATCENNSGYGIWSTGAFTVNGSASVTSTATADNGISCGINTNESLTANRAARVIGTSNAGSSQSYGICTTSGVTVNDSARVEGHSNDATPPAEPTVFHFAGIYTGNAFASVSGGSLLATSSLQTDGTDRDAWALMRASDADPLYCDTGVTAEGTDDIGTETYNKSSISQKWKRYKRVETTFAPPTVTITPEGGAQFMQGGATESAEFRVDSSFSPFTAARNFDHATLDGVLLDLGEVGTPGAEGSVANGSILITLNPDRLNELGAGNHRLEVTLKGSPYTGRTVQGVISVQGGGEDGIPATGDDSPLLLLCGLILLSGAGLVVARRRKRG